MSLNRNTKIILITIGVLAMVGLIIALIYAFRKPCSDETDEEANEDQLKDQNNDNNDNSTSGTLQSLGNTQSGIYRFDFVDQNSIRTNTITFPNSFSTIPVLDFSFENTEYFGISTLSAQPEDVSTSGFSALITFNDFPIKHPKNVNVYTNPNNTHSLALELSKYDAINTQINSLYTNTKKIRELRINVTKTTNNDLFFGNDINSSILVGTTLSDIEDCFIGTINDGAQFIAITSHTNMGPGLYLIDNNYNYPREASLSKIAKYSDNDSDLSTSYINTSANQYDSKIVAQSNWSNYSQVPDQWLQNFKTKGVISTSMDSSENRIMFYSTDSNNYSIFRYHSTEGISFLITLSENYAKSFSCIAIPSQQSYFYSLITNDSDLYVWQEDTSSSDSSVFFEKSVIQIEEGLEASTLVSVNHSPALVWKQNLNDINLLVASQGHDELVWTWDDSKTISVGQLPDSNTNDVVHDIKVLNMNGLLFVVVHRSTSIFYAQALDTSLSSWSPFISIDSILIRDSENSFSLICLPNKTDPYAVGIVTVSDNLHSYYNVIPCSGYLRWTALL